MFDRVYVVLHEKYFEFRREDWKDYHTFRTISEWEGFNRTCEQLEIKIELVNSIYPDKKPLELVV